MPDIEELVRGMDPLKGVDLPATRSAEAIAIYRRATAGKSAAWHGGHGRKPLALGGLALAGVTAALVAAVVVPRGATIKPTAAVLTLDRVAKVAAQQQPSSALPPGDYLYSEAVGYELVSQIGSGGPDETYSVFAPFTREVWTASDGSGRLLQQYTGATFLSSSDKAAWQAAGSPQSNGLPSILKDVDSNEGAGQLSPSLGTLPTDPSQLLADIEAGKVDDNGAPPGNAGAFQIVGSLLERTDASPALRAALYQVAAEIPGVTLVGTTRDVTGRTGTAVAFTSEGQTDELIFDPRTSFLLGEETIVSDPTDFCRIGVAAGTVISSTSYVGSAVVNSIATEVPSGLAAPSSYNVTVPAQVPAPVPTCAPPSVTTTLPPVSTTTSSPAS